MIGEKGAQVLKKDKIFQKNRFFPQAKLNYAENLLRSQDDTDALVFWGEDKVKRRLSHKELYGQVERLASALRAQGVEKGDRVAAFLPNMPETIIGMLAAASIGAIWSSCSPDFGVQGVLDRFQQIKPKVLFVIDYYYYKGKVIDCREKVKDIATHLPSVEKVIMVNYDGEAKSGDCSSFHDFCEEAPETPLTFERLPFDHPLLIMFSSGTTGKPKCIVHGAGGTLIQHLKEHQLHTNIKPGERFFYFTTCGWMMWNWMVTGLASGATLLLYDGSPFVTDSILFDYADEENMTVFGTSAKYIDTLHKKEINPIGTHSLKSLKVMTSTGSHLAPESFAYVYEHVKKDINLASISGGTDIVSCFALGNPIAPVYAGELQTRGLGLAVDVFDEAGKSLRGEKGELVCTQPFPCMPVSFWNDSDGSKFNGAYFERFPNIWHHGDYVKLTDHNGLIIYGRSDATLNSGGVRIGTAEIYRQVEQVDEVLESVCVGQEWDNDTRIILFVKLREGVTLDEDLSKKIKLQIRAHTTPRHVPAKILQVPDIPRTVSGKITEKAIQQIIHGESIKNKEALANPEALDHYKGLEELRG